MEDNITNYDLELSALVLHGATLLAAVPTVRMAVPQSGLNIMSTISWSKREASATNPAVADFLLIRVLHSRFFS